MKFPLLIISIFSSIILIGQQPTVDKVSNQLCDSIASQKSKKDRTAAKTREMFINILIANFSDWNKELDAFKKKSGLGEMEFDEYLIHISKLDCEAYRPIYAQKDPYLEDDKKAQKLYVQSQEFIYALHDNKGNKELTAYLNDSLAKIYDQQLNNIKSQLDKCERTSIFGIVFVNSDTFRFRYYDYQTREIIYQIDVIFRDNKNLLIDHLKIKDRKQLSIEKKERELFNKKVESGEIKLTPPPPPSKTPAPPAPVSPAPPAPKDVKTDQELREEAAREIKKQYDKLIQVADKKLVEQDYQKAYELYERAVKFNPDDQYPKDKIAEIEKILSDSLEAEEQK